MSIQQCDGSDNWKKLLNLCRQAFRHNGVNMPWRDRLLSAWVVLLMGILLLGTTAFGDASEDENCMNVYDETGAVKETICFKQLKIVSEVSCKPGYVPTDRGTCVPAVSCKPGYVPTAQGACVPAPDPCAQCEDKATTCAESAKVVAEKCIEWGHGHAKEVCYGLRRDCDGTRVDPPYTCQAGQCDGPGLWACLGKCMDGNPNSVSTTEGITLDAKLFGFHSSITVTTTSRDGIAKGCIDLYTKASFDCASEKQKCQQAHCSSPKVYKYSDEAGEFKGHPLAP